MHLIDTHCHVDLYPDYKEIISEAERLQIETIAVTTTPSVYSRCVELTQASRLVHPAIGLHPELVTNRHRELSVLVELIHETRFVGEVGLDYCTKDDEERRLQRRSCCQSGPSAWCLARYSCSGCVSLTVQTDSVDCSTHFRRMAKHGPLAVGHGVMLARTLYTHRETSPAPWCRISARAFVSSHITAVCRSPAACAYHDPSVSSGIMTRVSDSRSALRVLPDRTSQRRSPS
jgi:hypothetical protein